MAKLTLDLNQEQAKDGFASLQEAQSYNDKGGLVVFDDQDNRFHIYSRDNFSDLFEQGCGDTYSKDVVDMAFAQAADGISLGGFHDLCEKYSEPEEDN